MREKICGIYCIENKINGKKYIGQSIDIYSRWWAHKNKLNRNVHGNSHLQAAWNLQKEDDFNFYIIKKCIKDELDYYERYYIKLYNTMSDDFGYNYESGGSQNKQLSDSTRLKQSQIRIQNLLSGKIVTPPRKCWNILQIDLKGNIIDKWECYPKDIEEKTNRRFRYSGIYKCLNGNAKQYNGFIWVYEKDYVKENIDKLLSKLIHINIPVYQYDFNKRLVKIWKSLKDIQIAGYSSSSVSSCCLNKIRYHNNYIWSYMEISNDELEKRINLIFNNTPDKEVV